MPLREKAALIEEGMRARHVTAEGVLIYHRPCEIEEGLDRYVPSADGTLLQGLLVATSAFKFAVTEDPADRERLIEALRGLRLLHDVTGVPGLFCRSVFPASRQLEERYLKSEWHEGSPPHEDFVWRGDVSKDQYFGVLFGYTALFVALDLGAQQGDAELRQLATPVIAAVADHIWRHDLNIHDVDGERTKHGDLGGYLLGIIPIGPNAQMSLGFQSLAFRATAEPRFRERHEELLDRCFAEATGVVKIDLFGWTNHSNDNMGMMGLFAVTQLETREELLAIYDDGLRELWEATRNEANTLFHLVAASREELPAQARFDALESLRLFPVDPQAHPVDLREHPMVERATLDNRFGSPRNRTALPMHLRYRGSLAWAKCPFALHRVVKAPVATCFSGVDYLLAYWMARWTWGDVESTDSA